MLAACAPRAGALGAPRRRGRGTGAAVVPGGTSDAAGLPLPLYRVSRVSILAFPCVSTLSLALPRTMGVSQTRVRGSRAAPAACRRRLRDVVLNLSVSVHLAINLTKDLARARAWYAPPRAPETDARVCRALPQRSDSSERRNRLATAQQHCFEACKARGRIHLRATSGRTPP